MPSDARARAIATRGELSSLAPRWRPAVAFMLLLAGAAPSAAFRSAEHYRLSNLALRAAHQATCSGAAATPACIAAADLLAGVCLDPECGTDGARLSFGDFTVAPDHFTHTERIVPDPEDCRQRKSAGCPRELFDPCAADAAACRSRIETLVKSRVHQRFGRRQFPKRWIAVHRNQSHFRARAAEQYNRLHQRAVSLGRDQQFSLALMTEAVALHFLQDLFAAGHLASARADFSDPAAGSMHDLYNRRGLPFLLSDSPFWCAQLTTLKRDLTLDSAAPAPLASRFKAQLELVDADFDQIKDRLGGCGTGGEPPLEHRARGDGTLLDRPNLGPDARVHRSFLTLASAISVREVLAPARPEELLAICFQPQSATALGPGGQLANGEEVWAPGAVLTTTKTPTLDAVNRWCQPGLAGALAGYATYPHRGQDYPDLRELAPRLSVAEVSWAPTAWGEAHGGAATSRWEVGWNFLGLIPDSELFRRDGDQVLEKDFKMTGLKHDTMGSATLAVHHERHRDYDATGAGIFFQFQYKNLYGILEPGYAFYRGDARDAWRWRASGRLGIGYGVLFFEVGAERGFAIDATGDGHREWRYFAGPRLRLATSWLRVPFR